MTRHEPFNHLRLILARKRRKMTAIKVAEAAGISRVQLSRIETGQSEPTDETINALAKATRYPVDAARAKHAIFDTRVVRREHAG